MRALITLVASSLLVGCGPSVVGDWESNERTKGEANRLVVEAEFTASATLFIHRYVNGDEVAQAFEFDVTWDVRREGESYAFDMACMESPFSSGCIPEDDFRMTCDIEGEDENQLVCEADEEGNWKAYPGLAWHKVE